MEKKAINLKEATFTQAINISALWCSEWKEEVLSEEVLADRIAELIKTKNGLRGFFAYALSDRDCYLLDKLPSSIVFMLRERGVDVVEIVVKNLVMSSAQIIFHQRQNNQEYLLSSENISERCKGLLCVLETKLVTNTINKILNNLDNMGNSLDKSTKYDNQQKKFIKKQIIDIAN